MSVETHVREQNPTMQRLWLMEHGWQRGRNDKDWSHPDHPGPHTLAAAIRIALGGETP